MLCSNSCGANEITILPFDQRTKAPNLFSQKLAAHLQLILEQESHLNKVSDPGAGSWYMDALTKKLSEHAWQAFQEIESKGGMSAVLKEGDIQKKSNNHGK